MDQPAPDLPFAATPAEVARALDTDPGRGLDTDEVGRRRRRYGRNRLKRTREKTLLAILLDQVRSVIVWLLAAAAALSFYLGDVPEGVAIVVVLAINTAIGFFTELRAARSMEALQRIAQVSTRVLRAGQRCDVDADALVPGDVVLFEAGDVITADLRVTDASNLQCDESALTGESAPVPKTTGALGAETGLADRANMAFKGTSVTQGRGRGLVTATGMATEIGRISRLTEEAEAESSPLEKRLDRLGRTLVWLTLGLATLTALAGVLQGRDAAEMIQTGVALAVAAVPEGLPVVATLCLARGMLRMARRNAVIARLSAVETLGATTVILTDKTGTLTENRMTATRYLLEGLDVAAADGTEGRAFEGEDGAAVDVSTGRLAWALRIGALCNAARLGHGAHDPDTGDPMEVALLRAASAGGIGRDALVARMEQEREHAFDARLKMMATVHACGGGHLIAVKGAPEAVLERATRVLGADGERPLDEAGRRDWAGRASAAARRGYRLLALAMRETADPEAPPYEDLTLVGLVCLVDPVRSDVPAAIAASREAGVRVVMLTGDHADTATEIARQAGVGASEVRVIEGARLPELDGLDTEDGDGRAVIETDVFARVSPETKLDLAALFQARGEIVAMTGDGVNDAPALKKADIGIAMGRRGTQVAREAADMVLKDDAFPTILVAMREGRVIFSNIRKFVVYLMSCNLSEVLIVGLAVGGGMPVPLMPLQILFLNLVTDVFPAFALGLGRGDAQIMRRPPRDPAESIVDPARWILIAVLGGLITVATLAAFALALFRLDLPAEEAVTVAFVTLALAQLWNVFNVRDPADGVLSNAVSRNPWIWGALALCLGLVAAALWLPALSGLLHLPVPPADALLLAAGLSLLPLALGQAYLLLTRKGGTAAAGRA